jgi:predicted transcriptional regulator
MSNSLKVSLQTTIYSLSDRGWSRRRIARELGIDRETVGRYLRLAKPAIPTAGFEEAGEAEPAIATAGKIRLRQIWKVTDTCAVRSHITIHNPHFER